MKPLTLKELVRLLNQLDAAGGGEKMPRLYVDGSISGLLPVTNVLVQDGEIWIHSQYEQAQEAE